MRTLEELQINLRMLIEQREKVKDIKHIVQINMWIGQVERYIAMSVEATGRLRIV